VEEALLGREFRELVAQKVLIQYLAPLHLLAVVTAHRLHSKAALVVAAAGLVKTLTYLVVRVILQALAHLKEVTEALYREAAILAHLAVVVLVQLALMEAALLALKLVEMAALARQAA
jgi:hypothetical protein